MASADEIADERASALTQRHDMIDVHWPSERAAVAAARAIAADHVGLEHGPGISVALFSTLPSALPVAIAGTRATSSRLKGDEFGFDHGRDLLGREAGGDHGVEGCGFEGH